MRRGVVLPHIITEDTTLTADNYYLLPHSLLINEGATVTVEPGTQIEFWSPNPDDGTCPEYSKIVCVGTLRMLGAEDAHIRLFPSAESYEWGGYYGFAVFVTNDNGSGSKGVIDMRYCDVTNPSLNVTTLEQCRLDTTNGAYSDYRGYYGKADEWYFIYPRFRLAKDTLFRGVNCAYSSDNCYDGCAFTDCQFGDSLSNWNGLLLGNSGSESVRGYHYGRNAAFDVTATAVYHDAETGVSYLSVRFARNDSGSDSLQTFAENAWVLAEDLGGHVLRVDSPEELAFLTDAGVFAENTRYGTLAEYDSSSKSVYWNEKWNVRSGPVGAFLPVQRDSSYDVRFAWLQSDGKLHLDYQWYGYSSASFLIELADSDGALTAEAAQAMIDARPDTMPDRSFFGNAVLNRICTADSGDWLRIKAYSSSSYEKSTLRGNYWGTEDLNLMEKQITDFEDDVSLADLDPAGFLTEAPEQVWPFVSAVEIYDHAGEQVTTVGNEPLTFRVRFNRDMDESIPLSVRFGSKAPYDDYEIDGRWADARTWEGSTTLTTLIENGTQVLRISNGRAADEDKELLDDYGRFTFTIDDTSAAMDLIMQAAADDNGILLTWNQDAFDTLAGYHVYRSESEDGYYQRLNRSVIPADTREFYDDTVEPGKVYYYNFTVVKSDLTESAPSGKVKIMSKDTMAPVMYHTPVYQAFAGTNLVINATVTDNVAVQSVKLYYRQTGAGDWTVAEMNKLNDKYSLTASSVFTAARRTRPMPSPCRRPWISPTRATSTATAASRTSMRSCSCRP